MEIGRLIQVDSSRSASYSRSKKVRKSAQGGKRLGSIKNPDVSKRPCLSCNTRRVRCDLTKPTCQKCASKNISCSYERPFIFIHDKSTAKHNLNEFSLKSSSRVNVTLSNKSDVNSLKITNATLKSNVEDQEQTKYDSPTISERSISLKREDVDKSVFSDNHIPQDQIKGHADYSPIKPEPLHGTWNFYRDSNINTTLQRTATDLSNLIPNTNVDFVLELYDHFEDVILDYMVCYDSAISPYRFVLLSRGSIHLNILITICSIALTNFKSIENNKEIMKQFSSAAFKYAEISYKNLLNKLDDKKLFEDDINEIELILDDCLNILMQLSQSIFVEKEIINLSPSVLRKYLKVVHGILLELIALESFSNLTIFNKSYLIFTVQRFLVNDVLLSIVNDWDLIITDKTLIDYVKAFEEKLLVNQLDFKMLTFLEFSACPIEILDILFECQYYSKNVDLLHGLVDLQSYEIPQVQSTNQAKGDQTDEKMSDEQLILSSSFLVEKTCELQKLTTKVREKYEYYFDSTYKFSSEDMRITFLKIVELFSNTALILIYDKLMRLPLNSPQFIHLVDENLKIITQDISIGSGPDSCVYFPLMITAQRTILATHRKAINMYFEVSHWHLQLGCQKSAQQVLNNYFWAEKRLPKGDRDDVHEDKSFNYVIIY